MKARPYKSGTSKHFVLFVVNSEGVPEHSNATVAYPRSVKGYLVTCDERLSAPCGTTTRSVTIVTENSRENVSLARGQRIKEDQYKIIGTIPSIMVHFTELIRRTTEVNPAKDIRLLHPIIPYIVPWRQHILHMRSCDIKFVSNDTPSLAITGALRA